MHGENLWLDVKVDITVQLISRIIGLLIQGEGLEPLFAKESEKVFAPDLCEKYDTA